VVKIQQYQNLPLKIKQFFSINNKSDNYGPIINNNKQKITKGIK